FQETARAGGDDPADRCDRGELGNAGRRQGRRDDRGASEECVPAGAGGARAAGERGRSGGVPAVRGGEARGVPARAGGGQDPVPAGAGRCDPARAGEDRKLRRRGVALLVDGAWCEAEELQAYDDSATTVAT